MTLEILINNQKITIISVISATIKTQKRCSALLFFKMPITVAFYGDSYIRRLYDFCDGSLRVPATVCWFGKGGLRSDLKDKKGLTVDKNARANFEKLRKRRPDAVIINVGENDLSTTTKPRDIYFRIMELINDLQQDGVRDIYVAEIMTRGDFSRCPDPAMNKAAFDLQRKKINTLLAKELKGNFIKFHDIHYPADYSADLVHLQAHEPNTINTGLKKFECRLRRLICSLRY